MFLCECHSLLELIFYFFAQVDAIVLARSLSNLIEFICPPLWYLPVIDGFFLKTQPKKSYLKGDFMKIPIMTGDTEYEWLFSAIGTVDCPFLNHLALF